MTDKGTILIVDDTLASLKLLSDTLKAENYRVRPTQSGELALRSALAAPPELILLDIRMPGMDGFETCRKLKAEPQTRNVPVIFLSAMSETEEKLLGFELGAVDYISKPFQREELLARVHTHLQLYRLSNRLESLVQERTQALRDSEERFRVLVERAPDAIVVLDVDNNRILEANPKAEYLTGRSRQELLDIDPDTLYAAVSDDQRPLPQSSADYRAQALAGQEAQFERLVRHADGSQFPCEVRLVRLPSSERNLLRASYTDITERKSSEAWIIFLAHHDPLTGLANRVSLQQQLGRRLAQCAAEQQQLAVMMLDLDAFKFINDARGHHIGDLLLTQVADRLRQCVEGRGLVARQGGDEFIIVLHPLVDNAEVAELALNINQALDAPYQVEGQPERSTASIGIALYPQDGSDGNELIRHADMAMYNAKHKGGGTSRFFEAQMNTQLMDRLAMEADLRVALEHQQFVLHYQPQLELSSGRVVGLEALVRWQHPRRGMVAPDQFIPVAEQTGLILGIGNWVLREACTQLRSWQQQGLRGVVMAVNLSATQFQDQQLLRFIETLLAETGLSPACLELEITESSAMVSPQDAIPLLQALNDIGITIAIDDFGTGYSSLSYLKQFPIKTLKIDRTFVKDICHDEDDASLCDITTMLAHRLGLLVVAEGVETEAQRQFLTSISCDRCQGYLFSKPMPAAQVLDYIRSTSPQLLAPPAPASE